MSTGSPSTSHPSTSASSTLHSPADLRRDSSDRVVVATVVDLAHDLGMKIVAEGVEAAHQHAQLQSLRCDRYHGFYFSRPMGASDLEAMLAPATTG